jgi:Autophagy-related protein 13
MLMQSTTSNSSSGPRVKCDQVIFEAIVKAAEIIVFARNPSMHPSSQTQKNSNLSPPTNFSGRFNLQIPELAEIRQSLQNYRQSLHLPLRLDIYSNRVLVERWSLEYLQQQSHSLIGDPIVQLRQVCKKLVVWLRTLYCRTRMLPSFALRGTNVQYRLEVSEAALSVPQFYLVKSTEVPTPYGLLFWKVWYAPNVQRPTTKPIPIQTSNAVSVPSPIANVAKSAPTRDNQLTPSAQQMLTNHYQPSHPPTGSFDRAGLLERARSNITDASTDADHHKRSGLHTRSHSSTISHRSALHDPPTYAYNNNNLNNNNPFVGITKNQYPTPSPPPLLSQSPYLSATPNNNSPALLSSTPPSLGFLLPPAALRGSSYNNSSQAPPFSNLPRQLSKPEELCTLSQLPMPSSLDLLHKSPFQALGLMSAGVGTDPDWMRQSSTLSAVYQIQQKEDTVSLTNTNTVEGVLLSQKANDDDEEDDMPFAVEDESSFNAKKKFQPQSLSILDTEPSHLLSALSVQLQEFQMFGSQLDDT